MLYGMLASRFATKCRVYTVYDEGRAVYSHIAIWRAEEVALL